MLAFADGGVSRFLLTRRPLVWLGLASYSIYLWHLPVFVLSDTIGPLARRRWLVPIVLLVGTASYLLVERHSRHNRRILPLVAAAWAALLLAAAGMAAFERTYDTAGYAQSRYSAGIYDVKKHI